MFYINAQSLQRELRKMKREKNNSKQKNEKNEMEIQDFPVKGLETVIMTMLTKVQRTMHDQSENFNKQKIPNKNSRAEEYKNCAENFKEGFNRRLGQAEERIRKLDDGQ